MILKHLINPKPSIILFFIIFCVALVIFPLIQSEIDIVFDHAYLHYIIVLFLALAIPFFLSTGLNNIIYDKNIIRKDNFVVGVVFMLITSPFTNTVEAWISSLIMLFLFNFLLGSYQNKMPFAQFYNASALLGLLTFIYPNLFFLIIVIIISGINYSNLNWRIIFTIFLGIITPYLFYFVFIFVTEISFNIPKFFAFSQIHFLTIKDMHLSKIIWLSILCILVVFSFSELFMWLYKKSIKSRRTFMTIFWFFIVTILIANYSGWEYFYFTLMPLAIIIGNYFVYTKKRKIANMLFLLLVISSFYYKYMITFNV